MLFSTCRLSLIIASGATSEKVNQLPRGFEQLGFVSAGLNEVVDMAGGTSDLRQPEGRRGAREPVRPLTQHGVVFTHYCVF